jgi:hypothetical protein
VISKLLLFPGIVILSMLGMAAWGAFDFYQAKHPENHLAQFTSGTCFVRNGLREPWDIDPDGIVVMKGYLKYLVMFTPEAEKTGGGTKNGMEEDIILFDSLHHEVPCPQSWRDHTHKAY